MVGLESVLVAEEFGEDFPVDEGRVVLEGFAFGEFRGAVGGVDGAGAGIGGGIDDFLPGGEGGGAVDYGGFRFLGIVGIGDSGNVFGEPGLGVEEAEDLSAEFVGGGDDLFGEGEVFGVVVHGADQGVPGVSGRVGLHEAVDEGGGAFVGGFDDPEVGHFGEPGKEVVEMWGDRVVPTRQPR